MCMQSLLTTSKEEDYHELKYIVPERSVVWIVIRDWLHLNKPYMSIERRRCITIVNEKDGYGLYVQ